MSDHRREYCCHDHERDAHLRQTIWWHVANRTGEVWAGALIVLGVWFVVAAAWLVMAHPWTLVVPVVYLAAQALDEYAEGRIKRAVKEWDARRAAETPEVEWGGRGAR